MSFFPIYNIIDISNNGDFMNKEYLKNNIKNINNIVLFDEIDSTNTYLKLNPSNNDTLVIANKQTSGRGRLGRTFISNKDNGLYMSLLVRPNISLDNINTITCMVAVAIKKSLDELNINTSIKWVNDIYINNKKLAGILVESSIKNNTLEYLVIGIGINLYGNIIDENIKNIATTIEQETNVKVNKEDLVVRIVNKIYEYLNDFDNSNFMDIYISSSFVIGKYVDLNMHGNKYKVCIKGITKKGELIIINNDIEQIVSSGEITRMIVYEE